MDPLWTMSELGSLGELVNGTTEINLSGVSIDSRQIQDGDLFIALSGDPGPRFHGGVDNPRDGHEFIQAAVDNGAAAILLSQPPTEFQAPYIKVEDTLDGLWSLAALSRQRFLGQVVAITGSAGKTTAKSWLSEVLAPLCQVHASVGSLNNHWGVPLTLSRMARDADVGVIEIGTNHVGEISPLSHLAGPNISLLLNVLPAHIGNFGSIDDLRKEKMSIADGLDPDGVMILPFSLANERDGEVSFGLESEADAHGSYEIVHGVMQVTASICGEPVQYQLPEPGEHRLLTSLAVLAVVSQLGLAVSSAAQSLAEITSPKGRGNRTLIDGITIIDDSYNANPVSMIYAIESLNSSSGRKVALLGEILELGDSSEQYHQQVAEQFKNLDQVITVGEGFEGCRGTSHFNNAEEIDIAGFVETLQSGDEVLIKGSNKVFWQFGFVDKLISQLCEQKA